MTDRPRHEEAIQVLRRKRDDAFHEAVEAHEFGASHRDVKRCKEQAYSYHAGINALREDRGDDPLDVPSIEDVTGFPYRVTGKKNHTYPPPKPPAQNHEHGPR